VSPLADFTYRDIHGIAGIRSAFPSLVRPLGMEAERVDDLVLMASELMANALTHAATAEPRVRLVDGGGCVSVAVTDASVAAPEVQHRDGNRVGGNGLRIVEALADHWGVHQHDGLGKSVWFSLKTGSSPLG